MMRVTLLYSPAPRQVNETTLQLPQGATVAEALLVAGAPVNEAGLNPQGDDVPWSIGIWGRKCPADTVLRDGDRLELYRPLRVDPKVARRERFVGQGARNAGLFARRRPHSKAGY